MENFPCSPSSFPISSPVLSNPANPSIQNLAQNQTQITPSVPSNRESCRFLSFLITPIQITNPRTLDLKSAIWDFIHHPPIRSNRSMHDHVFYLIIIICCPEVKHRDLRIWSSNRYFFSTPMVDLLLPSG